MQKDFISLHILVIEDNDGLRQATVDFLLRCGHQAVGVTSAEDVDDTPTRDVPDLYLIDVNLPGEDGFSLTERIRKSQPMAGIVLMTARGQLHDRLAGYSSGADQYLIKPVEKEELLACIDSLARRLKNPLYRDSLTLELDPRNLSLKGPLGTVVLTHGESLLLAGFIRAAGNKLERWQAMQLVDIKDKGLVPANLEMRISALRKKINMSGGPDHALRAIRGFGYALTCDICLVPSQQVIKP